MSDAGGDQVCGVSAASASYHGRDPPQTRNRAVETSQAPGGDTSSEKTFILHYHTFWHECPSSAWGWLVSWWHAQDYIGFNLQWMVDIFWTHGRYKEYWTRSKVGECRILNTKHRSSQLVVSCNIFSELQVPPHRTQMAPGITKYIPRWNNQPFLTGGWRGTEPGRRVNQVWRCSVCRMKYSEKAPSAFHWNCCKQASQIQVETTCFHIS